MCVCVCRVYVSCVYHFVSNVANKILYLMRRVVWFLIFLSGLLTGFCFCFMRSDLIASLWNIIFISSMTLFTPSLVGTYWFWSYIDMSFIRWADWVLSLIWPDSLSLFLCRTTARSAITCPSTPTSHLWREGLSLTSMSPTTSSSHHLRLTPLPPLLTTSHLPQSPPLTRLAPPPPSARMSGR